MGQKKGYKPNKKQLKALEDGRKIGQATAKDRKPRLGIKHTKETRKKMSLMRKGKKKKPFTEEHKRNMGKSNYGENNPNWKGGISKLYHTIRERREYKKWRSDVFQRDNWNCQTCGKLSMGDIEAHHKKSFSKILKDNNIKTVEQALKCKELWDINNGVTLCKDCHKLTDNYGNKICYPIQ